MRSWCCVILFTFSGCVPSCQLDDPASDPCPGHASPSGGLFESNCDCPLASQIGPQLEGFACTVEGLSCATFSVWGTEACRCVGHHWSCGGGDMAIPREPDLREVDLGAPDLAAPDLAEDLRGGDGP
jgi:hypothetical protein